MLPRSLWTLHLTDRGVGFDTVQTELPPRWIPNAAVHICSKPPPPRPPPQVEAETCRVCSIKGEQNREGWAGRGVQGCSLHSQQIAGGGGVQGSHFGLFGKKTHNVYINKDRLGCERRMVNMPHGLVKFCLLALTQKYKVCEPSKSSWTAT